MSDHKNKWNPIPQEDIDHYFTKWEQDLMKKHDLVVLYDPVDKDYIIEEFTMPTYASASMLEIKKWVIETIIDCENVEGVHEQN